MRRIWMLGVLGLAGCPAATPRPADPTEGAGTDTAGPAAAPDDSPTRVRIAADDAEAHDLTPFDFSVDTAGTALSALPFPGENEYLILSGPPGGPQLLRFQSLPERLPDAAALEPLLRSRLAGPGYQPFVAGAPTEIPLGGSTWPALPFVTGESLSRTGWCAILVDSRRRGAVPQLLVLMGVGTPGEPDCAAPLADPDLAQALASLSQP